MHFLNDCGETLLIAMQAFLYTHSIKGEKWQGGDEIKFYIYDRNTFHMKKIK